MCLQLMRCRTSISIQNLAYLLNVYLCAEGHPGSVRQSADLKAMQHTQQRNATRI
jgi:hypothetical protein